jgi:phosphate transport system substrate-binding protein
MPKADSIAAVRRSHRAHRTVRLPALAIAAATIAGASCAGERPARDARTWQASSPRRVIRITGSDTMVNLVQAWAEYYAQVRPQVVIQVAGGGTGVGIAGLIEGLVDVAAAGRELRPDEVQRIRAHAGAEPSEYVVALDAVAVYVNETNPLEVLGLDELADIYGDGGRLERWSQLGVAHPRCPSDRIVRVSRQNNSGTYAYFRDVVLGRKREYRLGSVDQSGSKDVVALVAHTPCAIGYSGMAFVTPGARTLALRRTPHAPAIRPLAATTSQGSYPLVRPLLLYTARAPTGHIREFLEWVIGADGQALVGRMRFVPVPRVAAEEE